MIPPSPHAFGGDGPLFLWVSWVLTLLSSCFVAARLYTGLKIMGRLRADFYTIAVAWCFNMTAQSLETIATVYGIGNHQENLTENDVTTAIKYFWLGIYVCVLSVAISKLAVIALLLQIQGPTHPKMKWVLYFVGVSNTLIHMAQVFILVNQCSPPARLWDRSIDGTCNLIVFGTYTGFFQGSWSGTADLVLALYPIVIFWNLNMTLKRKIGLCGLMGGGLIATACCIVKTVEIKNAAATTDITYALGKLNLFSYVEDWVIIMVGSMPPLRPLFVKLFRKTQEAVHKSNYTNAHGTTRGLSLQSIPHFGGHSKKSGTSHRNTLEDNSSEENILRDNTRRNGGQIVITSQFEVEYGKSAVPDIESTYLQPSWAERQTGTHQNY